MTRTLEVIDLTLCLGYRRCFPRHPPCSHYSASLAWVQDNQAESLPLGSKEHKPGQDSGVWRWGDKEYVFTEGEGLLKDREGVCQRVKFVLSPAWGRLGGRGFPVEEATLA